MVDKKRTLWVVVYDISNNRRRSRITRLIETYGERVNFSVFECMLTYREKQALKEKIEKLMHLSKDKVIFYPLCLDCFSKVVYIPDKRVKADLVAVV